MVSFIPKGKQRKITLPLGEHLGHVQWIKLTHYYAVKDSDGSIIKGSIISDTDYSDEMQHVEDMRRVESDEEPTELWMYDVFGDEIENDKYHANGKLYNRVTHEYYPNGDIKQIMDSNRLARTGVHRITQIQIQKFTYEYDVNDNLLGFTEYIQNNVAVNWPRSKKTKNVYDASGNILEAFTFDKDTINPLELTLFRYNDKGQKTEEDRSIRQVQRGNDDLVPTEKTTFSYDEKGRVNYKAIYRFHAGLSRDETTTFDTSGKVIETRTYGNNKVVISSQVKRFFKHLHIELYDTYDADGMLTDYTISHLDTARHVTDKSSFHITYQQMIGRDRMRHNVEPGDTIMIQHIMNDEHFNMVEDDTYSYDGKIQTSNTYQYKYDSVGNWVDKLITTNNKPVEIEEREIGYFKE
ncbi:MAG TPA: hypothetical protein VNZ45_11390 [Bacteroidia bacterium]|jgi:hypothetical protein|nr:hypothetical protein [Bacteroidia bacterium]